MPDYFKSFGTSTPSVLRWALIFGKTITPEEIEAAASGEKPASKFNVDIADAPPPKRPLRPRETTDEWKAKVDLKTYKEGKRLGSGSFGETFLYQSQAPGSPSVVVKKALAQEGVDDLRNEERLYETVGDHPNIIKSMGMQKIGGQDCLVLEAIKGKKMTDTMGTLKKNYKEGKVSHEQFVGAMQFSIKQMLSAAAHLESKGVVHNDIAADNMMCDEETGEVKLFDFGVGVIEGESTMKSPWFKGIVSPEFASELISNSQSGGDAVAQPTAKHDIFAIGANAYEMSENQRFEYKVDELADNMKRRMGEDAFKQRSKNINDVTKHINDVLEDDTHAGRMPPSLVGAFGGKRRGQSQTALDIGSDAEASDEILAKETVKRSTRVNDGDDRLVTHDEDIEVSARRKKVGKYAALTAMPHFINWLMHPDPAQRPNATQALKHPFLQDSILDEDSARDVLASNTRSPQEPQVATPPASAAVAANAAVAPPVADSQAVDAAPPTTTAGQTTATTTSVNTGAVDTAAQAPVEVAGPTDLTGAVQAASPPSDPPSGGDPLRDDPLRNDTLGDDESLQGRDEEVQDRPPPDRRYTSTISGHPSGDADDEDSGPVDYDSEREEEDEDQDRPPSDHRYSSPTPTDDIDDQDSEPIDYDSGQEEDEEDQDRPPSDHRYSSPTAGDIDEQDSEPVDYDSKQEEDEESSSEHGGEHGRSTTARPGQGR